MRRATTHAPEPASDPGRRYLIAAVGSALAAGLALALIPVYSSGKTLLDENGASFIWLALAPALLVSAVLLMPSAARRSMTVFASGLLVAIALLTSIGVFFLPSAVCLVAATRRSAASMDT